MYHVVIIMGLDKNHNKRCVNIYKENTKALMFILQPLIFIYPCFLIRKWKDNENNGYRVYVDIMTGEKLSLGC